VWGAVALVTLAVAAGVVLRLAILPPADSDQGMRAEIHGLPMPGSGCEGVARRKAGMSEEQPATVTIPPERLQTIGVTYEPAARRPLKKIIRTVGRVAVDERCLAKVTIKFHGWIDKLWVSATGDHVKKGQMLFTIYSPDLVATQEEYLLALQSLKQLGESEFPEVARGSKELLEATRCRFQLWDITEDHIRELERTGKVMKTLPIHSPITGTVIKKEALAGAHVEPGEELYTIADLSHIWILADIYEYELSFVKV
jgi:Cu(I)/Ag(I) efflux system membrane fusion protein